MQPLQPDQARLILEAVFLQGLRDEHRITKAIIEAIPLDRSDYRPDQISRAALDLAWHIVGAEMYFMDGVATGSFNGVPQPRPEAIKNSADLTTWYTKHFEEHYAALSALSGEQLAKVMSFRNVYSLPAVSYLGFLLHHTVHHRGQLSTYLRPMGAKVPSIYGESYDATQARKALEQSA